MATQSFQRILEKLDEYGVDYIVAGGVAAVLRGAPVTTFDDVRDKAPEVNIGGRSVSVLGLEALIAEKRALGRPIDRAVAELLESVLKRQQGDR